MQISDKYNWLAVKLIIATDPVFVVVDFFLLTSDPDMNLNSETAAVAGELWRL